MCVRVRVFVRARRACVKVRDACARVLRACARTHVCTVNARARTHARTPMGARTPAAAHLRPRAASAGPANCLASYMLARERLVERPRGAGNCLAAGLGIIIINKLM